MEDFDLRLRTTLELLAMLVSGNGDCATHTMVAVTLIHSFLRVAAYHQTVHQREGGRNE